MGSERLSEEYRELVKKRVNELVKKLPPITPKRPPEMVRGRPTMIRDDFFKPENLIGVAWFFYGEGFNGYTQMIEKGVKKDMYYPTVGISQHESHYDGLYWVAWLWFSFPHRHGAHCFRVLKTGSPAITILKALHPYLRSPKKEEAEYIIEHGSPVTPNVKEEFRRRFPASKGRKVVVKSAEKIWLEEVTIPTPVESAYGYPTVIEFTEEEAKELGIMG